MSGKKIASAAVQNRTQTPFFNWLRNKLLAVERQPITPPPGIAGPDGKPVYHNPLRFPKTQSARPGSAEAPALPGGVHHKLNSNYYLSRDGRRQVGPPPVLYVSTAESAGFANVSGAQISKEEAVVVNKGPSSNFGLTAPTPGFGSTWTRSIENELSTPKKNNDFKYLERFDKFTTSN